MEKKAKLATEGVKSKLGEVTSEAFGFRTFCIDESGMKQRVYVKKAISLTTNKIEETVNEILRQFSQI